MSNADTLYGRKLEFLKELEKISQKYGISINAENCFGTCDVKGFKKIEYDLGIKNEDILPVRIIFNDGEEEYY